VADPLRVGVVGCGNVAINFHVPAYQALPHRYTLAGLAYPASGRLQAGREKAGLTPEQGHGPRRRRCAQHRRARSPVNDSGQ
jgi:predicted dehydrogenase